ncbi:aminotransferase-like domain-containing protein [Providencia sp. PROV141]|uniref:aminotransferase-like domain-containing protein n=1 Tax=Providencia sp. PROV141 TaxID=2949851 RepID=UPI00234B98F0|nr:PLP-dependent aminotransferase family protein [Providencia sp. PROV141]
MLLYKQIAQELQEKIKQGEFLSGEKMPSVRDLGRTHQVSITTAQLAYRELERLQLIYAVPKSGYFVIPEKTEALLPKVANYIQNPVQVAQWNPTMDFLRVSERHGVTSLSCAVPNIEDKSLEPLWQEMTMVARRKHSLTLEYDSLQGLASLREQIHLISDDRHLFTLDDIVTTTSGHQSLSIALQACTQGNDVIAVESPTFPGLLQTLYGLGRKIIEIPIDPETGMDLDRLEEAFERWEVKAVVVTPSCNNPMGCIMPDNNKQRLLNIVEKHHGTVIENDCLAGLAYQYPRPSTIQSLDNNGHVILCSSFSKTVAPGTRTGWIIPGKYKEKVLHLKYLSHCSGEIFMQQVMANFLKEGHYFLHLRRMRQHYSELQCQYKELVETHFPVNTRISRPQGGFSLWVEHLPADNRKLLDILHRNKVTVLTGEHFSTGGCFPNHLRINYALPLIARRRNAIKILGEALKVTSLK